MDVLDIQMHRIIILQHILCALVFFHFVIILSARCHAPVSGYGLLVTWSGHEIRSAYTDKYT